MYYDLASTHGRDLPIWMVPLADEIVQ